MARALRVGDRVRSGGMSGAVSRIEIVREFDRAGHRIPAHENVYVDWSQRGLVPNPGAIPS